MAITGVTDLGNGRWAITGDHDPTLIATDGPIGSVFIKIDDGQWFRKTSAGVSTNWARMVDLKDVTIIDINCGRNGTAGKNTYFHFADGMVGSATQGHYIPWDFTVTGITFARGTGLSSGTIELHRNGVLIPGATLATGVASYGANLSLSAAGTPGVIAGYWNSNSNTGDIQVHFFLAKKSA